MKIIFLLFNISFICLYQQILLGWFVAPSYLVLKLGNSSLNVLDYLIAGLFLVFLTIETISDQQQWVFQNEKHRRIKENP